MKPRAVRVSLFHCRGCGTWGSLDSIPTRTHDGVVVHDSNTHAGAVRQCDGRIVGFR